MATNLRKCVISADHQLIQKAPGFSGKYAFGFAGGYTQLNYQYQMTSSPLVRSLSAPSANVYFAFSLSLSAPLRRDMCMYFSGDDRWLRSRVSRSAVVQKEKRGERRMQNTRTLTPPMQTHIYLSAFPHMRANAQLFFFSCSPGVKRIQQITNLIVMCVCVCASERASGGIVAKERKVYARRAERYVLALSRYI